MGAWAPCIYGPLCFVLCFCTVTMPLVPPSLSFQFCLYGLVNGYCPCSLWGRNLMLCVIYTFFRLLKGVISEVLPVRACRNKTASRYQNQWPQNFSYVTQNVTSPISPLLIPSRASSSVASSFFSPSQDVIPFHIALMWVVAPGYGALNVFTSISCTMKCKYIN